MQKDQIIGIAVLVAIFAGMLAFWFYSPFYLEKKAIEREKAIEWLVYNDPNVPNFYAKYNLQEQERFLEYRHYIMQKYGISESDIYISVRPETTKDRLLDKNPIAKWLLGYD